MKKRWLSCEKCGREFKTRRGLNIHDGHTHFHEKFSQTNKPVARQWWLACDGFDRLYTAHDSYEAAKHGRRMEPIHVREVIVSTSVHEGKADE